MLSQKMRRKMLIIQKVRRRKIIINTVCNSERREVLENQMQQVTENDTEGRNVQS